MGSLHHRLPLCQIWWPQILQKCRYKVLHLSRDHVIKRSLNLVDAVTHTVSTLCKEDIIFPISIPISISMFTNYEYSAWTMCIWVLLLLQIHTKWRPDFNFLVYVSLTIYLMTIWLKKNTSIHSLNNIFNLLNENNSFVEHLNNSLNI